MKVVLLNGCPRKGWNTDLVQHKVAEGAESVGAVTEIIDLYDLDFMGCRSCMACNRVEGGGFGRCTWNDGLKPVLEEIDKVDDLVLGSPCVLGGRHRRDACFPGAVPLPVHEFRYGRVGIQGTPEGGVHLHDERPDRMHERALCIIQAVSGTPCAICRHRGVFRNVTGRGLQEVSSWFL